MMKNIICIIGIWMISLPTFGQVPYLLTEADVTFSDGKITAYKSSYVDIIIPNYLNGQVVTSIGNSAFYSKGLTSVIIPNSVISIEASAFNTNDLASIDIPNSVTYIGESAFSSNSLTSIEISNSVTSIGNSAFSYNDLVSVDIPNSVTSIGSYTFSYNDLTTVTIPNSVTYIGNSAFSYNYLTSVTIPNSVTYIGNSAFSYNDLANVGIPNSVIFIGNLAFYFNDLTDFVLPTPTIDGVWNEGTAGASTSTLSIDYIYMATDYTGVDADFLFEDGQIQDYYGPSGSLTIPATIDGQEVTSIGESALYSKNLTSIDIPSSVTSIGKHAFGYNDLTTVTIPSSVTSIGLYAFRNNSLTSVDIGSSVISIGEQAFSNNSLTEVSIPNSVTYIGEQAFNNNSLTNFTLPEPTATGFVLDGWLATDGTTYTAGETTSDFVEGYSLVVSEDNSAIISVLFENGTGDLSVTGDMSMNYTDISSANFFVVQGSDITLTPEEGDAGYGFTPQTASFTDIQESINQVFTYGLLTYSISYEVDGGTHDNPAAYTVEEEIALAVAVREGYEFVGWYSEAEFINQVISIAAGSTGDVTIYAQWEEEASEEEEEEEEEVLLIENDLAGVTVYPNPSTTGLFYLDLPDTAPSMIKVFDTSGHLVVDQQTSLGTDFTEVHVSLGTGMYLLHVSSMGKNFRKKIIIR